ncbi:WD40-repeat-containing domain protein [Baffinella frigidus]|nr:WD40-repeat-containing domain protein [Cryptophyta sp. CCMP2293]
MAEVSQVDAAELEHVVGFTGQDLHTMALHPLDANVILHGMGNVVVIADQTDPHKQDLLRGHDNDITAVAFSRSGRILASAQRASSHRDGEQIVVWDYESRNPIYRLSGVEGTVKCVKFSEDDRFLVAFGEGTLNGNDFAIWDMQNGSVAQYCKCSKPVTCLCWGQTVVADTSRRVKTPKYSIYTFHAQLVQAHFLEYDIRTMHFGLKTEKFRFPSSGLTRTYHDCCLSPTPGELLAGTSVGELVVFSADHLLYRASLPISTNGLLAIACAGQHVYIGSGDGKFKKMQGNDQYWTVVGEVQLTGRVTSLCTRADSEEIGVGTDAGKLYSVRADDMAVRMLQESNVGPITGVAFGRRADVFATISQDGTVRIVDLSDYSILVNARGPCAGMCLTWMGEDRLLTGWADGSVRIFSTTDGHAMGQIAQCHRGAVTCVAVGKEFIFTGGEDGTMRVWSGHNLEFVAQYSEHNKAVSGLVVDNMHGHLVHSCSLDRAVVTYDLKTTRRSNYKMHKEGGFTGLCQRVDSEQELLSSTTDGFVLGYDCDVQLPVLTLDCGRRMKFSCINISSTSHFIAVGCEDFCIRIWDLQAKEIVAVCRGHSGSITHVAWAPDEKQLVSVGEDSAICVWNFYLGGEP